MKIHGESDAEVCYWDKTAGIDPTGLTLGRRAYAVAENIASGVSARAPQGLPSALIPVRISEAEGSLLSHSTLQAFRGRPDVVRSATGVSAGCTSEDPNGDPLGLMGALFMRGTRHLIASLQPVTDFYMPALVCL